MNEISISLKFLGDLLKKEIKERSTSQKKFAEAIGLRPSHLSEIINGNRKIPNALIPQIASFIGLPIDKLLECQANSNVTRKKEKLLSPEDAEAEKLLQMYDQTICIKSLLKVISATDLPPKQRLDKLYENYNLPEPKYLSSLLVGLENRCFRRSSKNGCDTRMIFTWVLKAHREAREHPVVAPYDAGRNAELAEKLCMIFHRNKNTLEEVGRLLSEYGIGFAIVGKEEHASIDGYSFFMNGHPYIVITNRYQRIDNLAFTIMHEHGHITLRHTNESESMINVDERALEYDDETPRSEKEIEADNYATNKLIPENIWCLTPKVPINPFVIQRVFTDWAKTRNLNEWIVLGRVSHETGMYRFKSNDNRNIN